MRYQWTTLLLAGTVWVAVIWSAVPVHAQIGFDDSPPDHMRLWNADYYEIAIQKSDGRVLYIRDKTTGQDVSPGNVAGAWALHFSDDTWLCGEDFSPADPSRLFSYSWDPNTSTLTLDYLATGDYAVDVTLVFHPADGPELDLELTLRNNSAYDALQLVYPYRLSFLRSEIQGVFVPYIEGMKLLQNFFDDDGWDFISGYPGHLFADFTFSELTSGTLGLFVVRNPAEPLVPSYRQVTRDAAYAGGVARYHQNYLLVVPPDAQWTAPTAVLSIGSTLQQAMSSYWIRNGHDAMPTLADKLPPQTLAALSEAVLIKWEFWWGGMTFPTFQDYLSNLPADNLLHFVSFWPRGFDQDYPDYLPPNPALGTLSEFQELVSHAQSTGHLVMPHTNPTWWDDESPTLATLGPDIAVRNPDGTYRYETYGDNGGYVVSPHDPRVVLRQDQTRTEFTVTVPCDFLFEDQVGARPPTFDGHPDAPGPYRYSQGLVDLAARTASFLPPMSECGFDRLSWHEVGFCGSHLVTWHPWPTSTYVSYPMAQQWAHQNMVFYGHNLAQNTMTLDLPTLTYHVSLGYSLSHEPSFSPDLVWLKQIDKFQKHLIASLVGVGLDSYEYLSGTGRTRTSFADGVEIIANLNTAPLAYGDHVIAPEGFLADQAPTIRAGVLTTLHGQALSGTDPHYLIFEYSQNTITVFQPRGDDTPLTLPKPTSWAGTSCIQLKAVAESGTVFDCPLNVQGGYLLFDYEAEVDEQAIDHFVVLDCLCGDADCDGDVDFDDFQNLAGCLSGPGGGLGVDCDCFDADADTDVDLADFAAFQAAFTG